MDDDRIVPVFLFYHVIVFYKIYKTTESECIF